jgi:hypothetical protein
MIPRAHSRPRPCARPPRAPWCLMRRTGTRRSSGAAAAAAAPAGAGARKSIYSMSNSSLADRAPERLSVVGSRISLTRLHRASRTGQIKKNRANFSTTGDATGELDGVFVAIRCCAPFLRHGAAPSVGGESTRRFGAQLIPRFQSSRCYWRFISAVSAVGGAFIFCSALFYFACSGGHSPFDPGRTSLSAGAMSHSQCHIRMACRMETKRETRPPPAGVDTTERRDISCRLSMMSMPSVGSGITNHTSKLPMGCLPSSFVACATSWGVELTNGAAR